MGALGTMPVAPSINDTAHTDLLAQTNMPVLEPSKNRRFIFTINCRTWRALSSDMSWPKSRVTMFIKTCDGHRDRDSSL